MDIQTLLDYISNYVSLTETDVDILRSKVKYRKYLKGQYIVQQGDVCRSQCFVQNGCLRTFHIDTEGQEHTVQFSVENWWSADLGSFITQSEADFNVQCLENTEVLHFTYDHLQELFTEAPIFERFFRILIQNAYVASQKRIVRNFSLPARERYLLFKEQYPLIEQRVPQYMIASYLGITKEFLSKLKSKIILEQ